jgi:hypothetical protein
MGMVIETAGEMVAIAFRTLFGGAIVFVLLYVATRAHTTLWRVMADAYPYTKRGLFLARKIPETFVITKTGQKWGMPWFNPAYATYSWAYVSVLEDGLLISALPPASLICKPIFLPFHEMKTGAYPWMVWDSPVGLFMAKTPEWVIVLGRETAAWVGETTDAAAFGG